MAGREVNLPDVIEKRNILAARDVAKERLLELANAYFGRDSLDDAYNFFEKAGDSAGAEKVKQRAIELGIAAVLYSMQRSQTTKVRNEDWLAAGENAMKQSRFAYAAQAFRKAGDVERSEEALRQIPGRKVEQ